MDMNIGRILNALDTMGLEKNTLVVFLSDNGPENGAGDAYIISLNTAPNSSYVFMLLGSAGPFQGRKRSLYEGGIRVPAAFRWPGRIPGNRLIDNFALSTDLFPTFLHAAGISKPKTIKIDGISILHNLIQGVIMDDRLTLNGNNNNTYPLQNDFKYIYPKYENEENFNRGDERVVTWFKDLDGRGSAVILAIQVILMLG
jgi:arylsulfatase A-like enzyme